MQARDCWRSPKPTATRAAAVIRSGRFSSITIWIQGRAVGRARVAVDLGLAAVGRDTVAAVGRGKVVAVDLGRAAGPLVPAL